jgi:DUF971 family protein
MPVHHVRVGESALSNKSNVFGDVGVCWASPLAIHDLVKVVGLRGVRRLHIPPVQKTPVFPLRRETEYRLRTLPNQFLATEIKLRTRSRVLEVTFEDGARFELPFEYLRVHSPSAEVKGHGPGQEVLVLGKQNVGIRAVEPVGQYAVKLVYDDGHDSGLYSWKYLRELGDNHKANWAKYQSRVQSSQ